jgi:hypothetical protein
MDGSGREGGDANGDVLGTFGAGRAVLNPFTAMCDDGLTCVRHKSAAFVLHLQRAFQDIVVHVELRRLPRLGPTRRTLHVRNADRIRLRRNASDVFLDDLRLVSDGGKTGRLFDELWHHRKLSLTSEMRARRIRGKRVWCSVSVDGAQQKRRYAQ